MGGVRERRREPSRGERMEGAAGGRESTKKERGEAGVLELEAAWLASAEKEWGPWEREVDGVQDQEPLTGTEKEVMGEPSRARERVELGSAVPGEEGGAGVVGPGGGRRGGGGGGKESTVKGRDARGPRLPAASEARAEAR